MNYKSMKKMRLLKEFLVVVILTFITFPIIVTTQSLLGRPCPDKCVCDLDIRGRVEVLCTLGRNTEIPTIRMSPSSEVIRLIPPDSQPNHLTIGRFFTQFKKLEELHIVNSNIPNIGENSFWGVQSLRTLNLTRNNINLIIESNFKGLISLEVLSLSHNKISSFTSACFSPLAKLRELDLSWNRATKLVERQFYNLYMLEVLNLSGNWLQELSPEVFRDIWKLKELRCRSCGLKGINPYLYKLLSNLRFLDLGENEFKYLSREEFESLIHLRDLRLDGNQLSAITDDTFRSQNLYILLLSSNRIAQIERNAFRNTTIGYLDLSGNKFESLDVQIFSQSIRRNLSHLDLSRNPKLSMSSIGIILSVNPQLRQLILADSKYEELPLNLFEQQEKLELLNLSGNYLPHIFPHQLSQLRNLRVLDISRNRLKSVDGDVLTYIDQLQHFKDLRLAGNPWACDLCNIPVLLKWIQMHPIFSKACNEPYGPYCLRCSSPPAFYDKALTNLDESMPDWCNTAEPASILAADPKFGLFIASGFILLILIIASVVIALHYRWHAAHYYTHEEDRPEIGTPPLPPDYDLVSPIDGFNTLFLENNGNKPKIIATIEEIPYETHYTSNGNRKHSYPPQLTSFKSHPTTRPDLSINNQSDFNR